MVTGFVTGMIVLFMLQYVQLGAVLRWSDRRTLGARYYSRPVQDRRRFRRLLRLHRLLLSPILGVLAAVSRSKFSQRCFVYKGVPGPAGACSSESYRQAAAYVPRPEDVLVVTQMRCGTTWMQHMVYQVLLGGQGDLAGDGSALGSVSPWLESTRTIGVHQAPLVGRKRPSRLIKTHLPASLCPFSNQAKYIYVVRHPVSCFASCVDYLRNNLKGFAPGLPELEQWFCSAELMWWNTWIDHLAGWWPRADSEPNVLLVRFEDMTKDLPSAVQQVARFLALPPLDESEVAAVVEKCGFAYMREHAEAFEMHPPQLLQAASPYFVSGRADRSRDLPPDAAERIAHWCRAECAARGLPVARLYPDLGPVPQAAASA